MPAHDWTGLPRLFWSQRLSWIVHMCGEINTRPGLDYSAMPEMAPDYRAARRWAMSPPPAPDYESPRQSWLCVRRNRSHELLAVVDVVLPAEKATAVDLAKTKCRARGVVRGGAAIVVIDLHRPGPADPGGVPGAIRGATAPSERSDSLSIGLFTGEDWASGPVWRFRPGDEIPDVTVPLGRGQSLTLPLERTYREAFDGYGGRIRVPLGEPIDDPTNDPPGLNEWLADRRADNRIFRERLRRGLGEPAGH